MGRRKIAIQQLTDPKLRNITYNKRKNGLIKKAAEISLLCGINLMLVFEDLNGNLVQFSRNKLKSIGSFPNECTYKRILELTAEDYPNFTPIKRHKKNQENCEEKKFLVPELRGKKGARCLEEVISEDESSINVATESPDTNFSEESSPAEPQRCVKKVIKTSMTTQVSAPVRSHNLRQRKNRPILHLNVSQTDETDKDAIKGNENQNQGLAHGKTFTQKSEIMMSPTAFLDPESQSHHLNAYLVNLFKSPCKQDVTQRRPVDFPLFGDEEDTFGARFSDLIPSTLQEIGLTPLPVKQVPEEDQLYIEKMINYLSHSTRLLPQHQEIFTFQKPEIAFLELLYNGKERCRKMDTGSASASRSGYKFNFEGYSFGNDERI